MRAEVVASAELLAAHKGGDTVVLDLRGLSAWTDYFVITSATSVAHMRGLCRHLEESLGPRGLSPRRSPKIADDEEWCLLDYGDFVVHVMSAQGRTFYELEKLWYEAPQTRVDAPPAPNP